MVVDKDVCERWWLTRMCVRDGVTKMVVDKEEERAEEEREEERQGYRIKNKNPTQRCGEKDIKRTSSSPPVGVQKVVDREIV